MEYNFPLDQKWTSNTETFSTYSKNIRRVCNVWFLLNPKGQSNYNLGIKRGVPE